jgi:hypothetical protein
MSDGALSLSALALAPPSPHTWLSTEQAAALMEVSTRHICRIAVRDWVSQGLARQVGGVWQIRQDAHPKLNPLAPVAPQKAIIQAEVAKVGQQALSEAGWKKHIVEAWQKHLDAAATLKMSESAATIAFLAKLAKDLQGTGREVPSRRTLYYWQKKLSDAGAAEALVDGRVLRKSRGTALKEENPFFAALKQIWATSDQRKVKPCYDAARFLALSQGWDVPSLLQARRFVDAIDRREAILRRKGKEAFVNDCLPHETRDYTTGESNDQWVSDHHQFDVFVKVGSKINPKTGVAEPVYKRPWLTAWMDMRSRKIVAWQIREISPNYEVVLQTLCAGCLSHGVPVSVYSDNGKDYDNQILTGETKQQRRDRLARARKNGTDPEAEPRILGIYAALDMKHTHALPRHPQSKTIERFFGTVCERFSKFVPMYCGNAPENRPEGFEKKLVAGEGITLEAFTDLFSQWVDVDYNQREHTGDGLDGETPARAWELHLKTKRTAPREVLEMLMQPRLPRKVNQLGVEANGLTYGRYVLNGWIGQTLFVRINLADVSCVTVWSQDDEFLCLAPCNDPLPMQASAQDLREARRELQGFARKLREAYSSTARSMPNLPSMMLSAAAEKARVTAQTLPALPASEPTLKLVRGDMEGPSTDAMQAMTRAIDAAPDRPVLPPGLSLDEVERAYGVNDE